MSVALDVFARYRNPETIALQAERAKAQSHLPKNWQWVPYSLSFGDAGIALALGYVHRVLPSGGWDETAHQYLARATTNVPASMPIGLLVGLGGLVHSANYLSMGGERYKEARQVLTRMLDTRLKHALPDAPVENGLEETEYDVVSGLAGVGRCLLGHHGLNPNKAVSALSWLNGRVGDAGPFGFRTNANADGRATQSPSARGDGSSVPYINLGLAHGLPGVLAVLALSRGFSAPNSSSRHVLSLAEWLVERSYVRELGPRWPTRVYDDGTYSPSAREGWCYGIPGVANAIFLAGRALGDQRLMDFAVDTLLTLRERSLDEMRLTSPTFCHGLSGLLQVVARLAVDTRDERLRGYAQSIAEGVLAHYDVDSTLGFRDEEMPGVEVDSPGLLTGAIGAALPLLSVASHIPPGWDSAFLLS